MLAAKKLSTRLATPAAARSMAGKAAFNWRDPLHLEAQLTDEELMIKVRMCVVCCALACSNTHEPER